MPPPLVLPPELGVTVEDIFHPVDRAAVPELAPLLDYLAEHHPLVLAAVADVDRSLIWSMMESSPWEKLRENCRLIRSIELLQDAMPGTAS